MFLAAAKALAAKTKKPILPKKILIPQSDHEDSTQDSVSESVTNVSRTILMSSSSFICTLIISYITYERNNKSGT